jgi:hypothetical protein
MTPSPHVAVPVPFPTSADPDGMRVRPDHPTPTNPNPSAPIPVPIPRGPDIFRTWRNWHNFHLRCWRGSGSDRAGRRRTGRLGRRRLHGGVRRDGWLGRGRCGVDGLAWVNVARRRGGDWSAGVDRDIGHATFHAAGDQGRQSRGPEDKTSSFHRVIRFLLTSGLRPHRGLRPAFRCSH